MIPTSPTGHQLSPAQDKKSATTASSSRLGNADGHRDAAGRTSPVTVRAELKKKPKHARARTRTPTPVAILEQELADAPADDFSVAKREVQDPGVSLEPTLAASTSVDGRNVANDDPMDLDVDDELLSLVDDNPHTSHHSAIKHTPNANHHCDSHHRYKAAQASEGATDSHLTASSSSYAMSQRESMPPPMSTPAGHHKESSAKADDRSESVGATSSQKKKDGVQKPAQRPKAPPKPRAKASTKPKPKPAKDNAAPSASPVPSTLATSLVGSVAKSKKMSPLPASAPSAAKRSVSTAAGPSRSRSTSVMPGGSVGPDADTKGTKEDAEDAEDEGVSDDKLYCVCKTRYDEDRVMIACDRCDEWYHTQCVDMPDLEIDLVDQFICPPCIESNQHLSLKTTYKRRCLRGLKHPNPSSPSACHKPARGVFSKYCSDECGVLYMQLRIDAWGGDKRRLWESVKDAEKREGVVVRVKEESKSELQPGGQTIMPAVERSSEVVMPSKTKGEWKMARLHAQLGKIAESREELKKDMEVVVWREKLLELATARADNVNECGWDQRLCFGDEECAEFGAEVLESYEELEAAREDRDAMQVEGTTEEGEWWCKGKKKCDRHAGWQKLRFAEISFDKETKESALLKLTTQERDIRRQIEDVTDPKARTPVSSLPSPLQPLNGQASSASIPKAKLNGDSMKKGKKKKS
ncbi:hypothetical protein B0H21DRAFT_693343 [Amylocystis lapponica]|nr:hypothetical protein B0H21DRAFT_693343 [Amylocystis lapponica]